MTVAICTFCGRTKHGSFTPCPKCGCIPLSSAELAKAMAMTDNYLSPELVEHYSELIKEGGEIIVPVEVLTDFNRMFANTLHSKLFRQFETKYQTNVLVVVDEKYKIEYEVYKLFDLSHQFVNVLNQMDNEYNGIFGVIKNLFKRIDYQKYQSEIERIAKEFDTKYLFFKNWSDKDQLAELAVLHLNDLNNAIICTKKAISTLVETSMGSKNSPSFKDFKSIKKQESIALRQCNPSGQNLTNAFHEYDCRNWEIINALKTESRKQDDIQAVETFWYMCLDYGQGLCSEIDKALQAITNGEIAIPENDFSKLEVAFAIMGVTVMILKSSPKMSIQRATAIEKILFSKIENIELPPQYVEYFINAFNEYRIAYSHSLEKTNNPFGEVSGHLLCRIFEEGIVKLCLPNSDVINPMTHQMVGGMFTLSVTDAIEYWKDN